MAPAEITLDRTGDRPVIFTGEMLGSFKSPNATYADKETSSRQWFLIDLFRTSSGKHIAHIRYRAGSKLGREIPKDAVYIAPRMLDLFDEVKMIDATQFVVGHKATDRADPADAIRWHDTACTYAKREFTAVLNKFSHYVTKEGGAERID